MCEGSDTEIECVDDVDMIWLPLSSFAFLGYAKRETETTEDLVKRWWFYCWRSSCKRRKVFVVSTLKFIDLKKCSHMEMEEDWQLLTYLESGLL
mgnify:CR=1 FL=1|jgi:hypothetical protein